ncbi:MAG TPA: mechanosensitive ion channel family protein [Bryobacteraceae bacterium]|nr:mechanosensitive ion channel family protein [Bryobacteraceae bacterium]
MRFRCFSTAAFRVCFVSLLFAAQSLQAAPAAPAMEKLERWNPRSSVTAFLQACRKQDYDLASQYLDLRYLPEQNRQGQGPALARKLETALNLAPDFNVLDLSRNSGGSMADTATSPRASVASLSQNGETYTLELERVALQPGGPPVWVFSPDTVVAVLRLNLSISAPWVAHYLPPFMTSVRFLETALWEWLALTLAAALLVSLSRLLDRVLAPLFRTVSGRLLPHARWAWMEAPIRPIRMLLSVAVFRVVVEVVRPAAIARLYIGRMLELIVMWSIAWFLVRIVDLFLNRVESNLATQHRFSGRSILRLGRRTASVTIVIIAILTILSSWGYNTATLVAGLGVGGIAVALAAQQTIANIFGGISVIGDRPVAIGTFGKFGDLMGTIEDIGMRSTRVRTLNRTLVSIPNATFAGINLENYALRDKILFNPAFQIKRSTPDEEVWHLIEALRVALEKHPSIELVPTPVRLIGLTATAFNIEIFCYVLTPDIDQFYKTQGELFLTINDALQAAQLELV